MNLNNSEKINKFDKLFKEMIDILELENAHAKILIEFNIKDGNIQAKVKITPTKTILI